MLKICVDCELFLSAGPSNLVELRKDYVGIYCNVKYQEIIDELKKYFYEQPYCIENNLTLNSMVLYGQKENEIDIYKIEDDYTLEKYVNSNDKHKRENSDTVFIKGTVTFEKKQISESNSKFEEIRTEILDVFDKIEKTTKNFAISSVVVTKQISRRMIDKFRNKKN